MRGPCTAVARVARAKGLAGSIIVEPLGNRDLSAIDGLECWVAPPLLHLSASRVRRVTEHGGSYTLDLDGVTDRRTARSLVGRTIMVRSEIAPPERKDEREALLGWQLVDVERGPLGTITRVIVTGANDVWVANGPFGEILVPVIDEVIEVYDEDARTIRVRLLPGLLDEE